MSAIPFDAEAERGALACVVDTGDVALLDQLCEADFHDERHLTIFRTLVELQFDGEPIDAVSLPLRLKSAAMIEGAGGMDYVASLPEAAPSVANWPTYLQTVKDKATRRAMLAEAEHIKRLALDTRTPIEVKARAPIVARNLFDLVKPRLTDRQELLRSRFLCRGGGLLLAGPTGIGKSSLSMQAMILWAVGKPCFGIEPNGPLKSLLIQAENDDGDLVEMRDGVSAGLELSRAEIEQASQNLFCEREDVRTSNQFFREVVGPLLSQHKPDLLWIDPALAFLGGETSSQKDVGAFLRNGLNPLLHEHDCAAVIIHHTNKPPTGKEKSGWQAGDFAYLGSGSAEWANWARGVLVLRSIGSHNVFELRAAKRGGRLGWTGEDGTKSFARHIGHATEPGVICWREASADDADSGGRPKQFDADELLELLPPGGLSAGEWQQIAAKECGIKEATFHRLRRALSKADRILKSKASGNWQPVTKRA